MPKKRMRCEIYDEPEAMREAIPKEDYAYWLNNCEPYPDPKDPGHLPPRHELPEACTYKLRKYQDTHRRYGHCSQCGECCIPVPARMKDGDVCRYAYQEE